MSLKTEETGSSQKFEKRFNSILVYEVTVLKILSTQPIISIWEQVKWVFERNNTFLKLLKRDLIVLPFDGQRDVIGLLLRTFRLLWRTIAYTNGRCGTGPWPCSSPSWTILIISCLFSHCFACLCLFFTFSCSCLFSRFFAGTRTLVRRPLDRRLTYTAVLRSAGSWRGRRGNLGGATTSTLRRSPQCSHIRLGVWRWDWDSNNQRCSINQRGWHCRSGYGHCPGVAFPVRHWPPLKTADNEADGVCVLVEPAREVVLGLGPDLRRFELHGVLPTKPHPGDDDASAPPDPASPVPEVHDWLLGWIDLKKVYFTFQDRSFSKRLN